MNGTTKDAKLAIDLIPPIITTAAPIVIIIPTAQTGKLKAVLVACVIALTCGKVPDPKRAVNIPKNANALASHLNFFPRPFSI